MAWAISFKIWTSVFRGSFKKKELKTIFFVIEYIEENKLILCNLFSNDKIIFSKNVKCIWTKILKKRKVLIIL